MVTLIGQGLADESIVPKGLSNLSSLLTLNPVLTYPVSYLLSELLQESLLRLLRFLDLLAFFWLFA